MGRNCCGAGRGADVGVGTRDPERGSGCRVRDGVVERGGVLERLWRIDVSLGVSAVSIWSWGGLL